MTIRGPVKTVTQARLNRCVDALSLHMAARIDDIAGWSRRDVDAATKWAIAWHLKAADNPGRTPRKPKAVERLEKELRKRPLDEICENPMDRARARWAKGGAA